MKATINGIEYEMSVEEFKQLSNTQQKPRISTLADKQDVVISKIAKYFEEEADLPATKTVYPNQGLGKFNRFKQWSNEDTLKLITAHKQGVVVSKIAKYLGRTTAALRARLSLLQHDKVPGVSYKAKANKVRKINTWSIQEEATLKAWVKEGMTQTEIRKRLNRSQGSISGKMYEMGL